jgi:hypothetical protein
MAVLHRDKRTAWLNMNTPGGGCAASPSRRKLSAFRDEIERDGRMCLNGMLGAEAGGLPSEVVEEIEVFFRRCLFQSELVDPTLWLAPYV